MTTVSDYQPPDYNSPTDCLKLIEYYGETLERFSHQTMDMARAAVKKRREQLQYVYPEFKTRDICLLAVIQSSEDIQYVPSELLDYGFWLDCVKYSRYDILWQIPKEFQTAELCYAAVEHIASSFSQVLPEFKTKEICYMAVKNRPYMIVYVPEELQTRELYLLALQNNNGGLLQYIPQDLELCLIAIRESMNALQYVNPEFKTMEVCLAAVKHSKQNLQYVPAELQTEEMYLIVVRQDGLYLSSCKNPSYEVCLTAVRQNRKAINYVPAEWQDDVLHQI